MSCSWGLYKLLSMMMQSRKYFSNNQISFFFLKFCIINLAVTLSICAILTLK